jgi:hypothetical protein
VPVSAVAHSLTDHLIDEITNRGTEGGPLTPLADQLNHDLTHLQGEEVKGMLAQLLGEVRDALASPDGAAGPVGWPLAEVRDPFALEVHRPVEPDVPQPQLPVLPVYVPREHNTALAQLVMAAAGTTSGIAVLVGGSSTGKTRTCWQALELLRGQEPEWRLRHPIDPQAALAGLPGAGPRTVVWLNEAQRYLDTPDGTGERIAAGLRTLLRDRTQGPVLVLATLWPEFWAELTARQGARTRTRRPASCWTAETSTCPVRSPGSSCERYSMLGIPGWPRPPPRAGPGRSSSTLPGARPAGPLPQRAAGRPIADRGRDGRPPPGHAPRPAPGLSGDGRARIPDRLPSGSCWTTTG